jgi:hypothetical protein
LRDSRFLGDAVARKSASGDEERESQCCLHC